MELPLTDKLVDRQRDALFNYSAASQTEASAARPWSKDPTYFKTVRVSPTALVKMVMHARSGGALEIMGIMQGYVDGTALVVTDAFRLPVEGTETRVNAQSDADEYLVEYLSLCRDESRQENVIGWYHSHPGYGCWLSGIDVATQQLQQLQGPMVAIVIDPDRTISANQVEIGAFRTYPEDYTPPTATATPSSLSGGGQSVPLVKADDFGAHASKYYPLEVEHYKSTLDGKLLELLWNKYWVQTLAQNPLLTNRDYASSQMADVAQRVRETALAVSRAGKGAAAMAAYGGGRGADYGAAEGMAGPSGSGMGIGGGGGGGSSSRVVDRAGAGGKGGDGAVEKLVRDIGQIAAKERAGLAAAEIKAQIFGGGNV
ncbi:JAB1/Mov34/MPN/PAD-1 ubiquitin protease-domain-containing protein [Chaetomium tenue]|uniref:JAB1/Mov34/MPN/PAD-1 ubiquitin protease-domain-containing protein n=1 Tax=Chaetomium tenue TaxID=1854479 RepID=A0ACB7PFF2_9PEZI|nr:JAB1/Mov34/MPN/PAD-1 ubiquitin protease-domain-containing protein [Chaetomium globosum]